jgi:peptide/nickel transport system ATP-binding protein
MAVAGNPRVLLADEPTTGLDVTVQAQILELLGRIQADRGMSIVLISHDLGVVAAHADRVLVMYAGRVAEIGDTDAVYEHPQHAYTLGLLNGRPRIDRPRRRLEPIPGHPPPPLLLPAGCPFHPRCRFATDVCRGEVPALDAREGVTHLAACHHADDVVGAAHRGSNGQDLVDESYAGLLRRHPPFLLEVENLVKHYRVTRGVTLKRPVGTVKAVDGVSFEVAEGETLGLVGESGCGKSTIARTILRLVEPTSGSVRFSGEELSTAARSRLKAVRREMQLVFQDPYASLDPRVSVRAILTEPFAIHGVDVGERVAQLLSAVGLSPEHADRYPHELSGGERQRVGIARALALNPKLLICDEPVSLLDVSIQAQVLNLLEDLQQDLALTYVVIAHDLSVVRRMADRIAVMYLGRIVEIGSADHLFSHPSHPYTQGLISSIPLPDPRKERIRPRVLVQGEVPSALDPPAGCPFRPRCPKS